MHFTGTVYRNPYWPTWPLLEITQGCTHNKCKFCTMYKDVPFRMSPMEWIEEDLTLTGNLILTVLLAFAEYERGMIVERTQSCKAIAKQNPDFREGRPKKYMPQQLSHALDLLAFGKTYKEVEALTGISKSTLIRNRKRSR